jgi:WXXGXW repeat (2 copies)
MPLRQHFRAFFTIAVFAVSLTAAACASAAPRGRVYVRVGPPAPIVETRVVSPGPGFVWVPGFYRWQRAGYVWVPGRWDRPPRARAVWVPARWVHARRGWYLVEGHWR